MSGRLAVLAFVVVASLPVPAASAAPARDAGATTVTKAKACKQREGETKGRWLRRCKCRRFKGWETRVEFRRRCPGARVPRFDLPREPRQPLPAVERFRSGLMNTTLRYVTDPQNSDVSDDERYVFCYRTFTYVRHRVTRSGRRYDTRAEGDWRIVSAKFNADGISGSAVLHYDLVAKKSNDVDRLPSSADVPVSFHWTRFNLDGREYDAAKVSCN
jgi:hypothetical protein